jgi:transposase
VTNVGSDLSQLSHVAKQTKATLQTDTLEAVADRGYFNSEEILACDQAGVTVTLPKPIRSGINVRGRFGKQDFVYLPEEDVYRCPAGERLRYYFTTVEGGLKLRRYWTNACRTCALKSRCTTAVHRRITRWSMFSKPCRRGSPNIPRRCVSGARRSSIPSARSRRAWARPTS